MQALHCIINTTSVCTQHCPNCYYTGNGVMDEGMVRSVASWIRGVCKGQGVKEAKIQFLGGEPLTNLPILLSLMEALDDLPGHPDGKFITYTNGSLLTESVMGDLKAYHTKVMLNPTHNNLVWVLEKASTIKRMMGGVSLSVVADATNLPRLAALTAIMCRLKGAIRINRLYDGASIPGYIDEYKKQMHRVFDIVLESDYVMYPNFILESTYPLWPDDRNPHSCGRWLVIIDPNGNIRSCNPDMSTVVGNVHTTAWEDIKFHQRWSAKGLPECQGCEWSVGGWCQGGCPYTRKLTFGSYGHKTPFCEAFKELFPRLKELKDKWIACNEVKE